MKSYALALFASAVVALDNEDAYNTGFTYKTTSSNLYGAGFGNKTGFTLKKKNIPLAY